MLGITVGGPGGAAAGTSSSFVIFHNQSQTTCTLHGHPGVSYVTGSDGHQVGAAADREGDTTLVSLKPGDYAHAKLFTISYQNYDPPTCQPTTVEGYRVYPPDQTGSAFIAAPGQTCGLASVHLLRVDGVLPGKPTSPDTR